MGTHDGQRVGPLVSILSIVAILSIVSFAGCSPDPTWVRIHLDAQDQSCRDATHLTVLARSRAGGDPIVVSEVPLRGGCRGEGQLPGDIVFVPGAMGVGGRFWFEAVLSRGDEDGSLTPFNWVRLDVDFQEHVGREVLLCFEDKCRGHTCDTSGCASGAAGEDGGVAGACEVCFAGSCVPAEASFVALSGTTCPGCLADEVPYEESCHDGVDNDCDGLPDCTDTDCTHFSDGVRRTEDPRIECDNGIDDDCDGQTDIGDCDCRPVEVSCGDNLDNDCDGDVDCADSDCDGVVCGSQGLSCVFAENACRCVSGSDHETSCTNGVDDDCDGLVDCDDVCPGNESLLEGGCGNGQDDDCDGAIDCGDLDCGTAGPELCHNGRDDNCNDLIDCDEASCRVGSETFCGNGVDDDCDGLADCMDPDCLHRPCVPGLGAGIAVCCGDNVCRRLDTDARCGGCNINCQPGTDCRPVREDSVSSPIVGYACSCARDGDCPRDQRCLDRADTPAPRCNCESNDECTFDQHCTLRPGFNNYCAY